MRASGAHPIDSAQDFQLAAGGVVSFLREHRFVVVVGERVIWIRRELEVSPRTLARDLDFLRDEERAPIEYDARAHGYRLTDESYRLPPVRISRKEAFGFALARKLLKLVEVNVLSFMELFTSVRLTERKTLGTFI